MFKRFYLAKGENKKGGGDYKNKRWKSKDHENLLIFFLKSAKELPISLNIFLSYCLVKKRSLLVAMEF